MFWSFLFSYCFFSTPLGFIYIYIYIQLKSSPMTKNLPSDRPKLPLKKRTWMKTKQQSKACNWIIRFIMVASHKSFISIQFERDCHTFSPLTRAVSLAHPQQIIVRSTSPGKFVFKSWEIVITMSGEFESLWSAQDGNVPFLQINSQRLFCNAVSKLWIKNVHWVCFYFFFSTLIYEGVVNSIVRCFIITLQ